MDLVSKRYSSPFLLLDECIINNNLSEFIDFLLEKSEDEKLWEIYLASIPFNDKSFEQWKKEINSDKNTNVQKTINMTQKEIDATIEKSRNILNGFKPPLKGGK